MAPKTDANVGDINFGNSSKKVKEPNLGAVEAPTKDHEVRKPIS